MLSGYLCMNTPPPSWEMRLLGDTFADVVNACQEGGAQIIVERGRKVAVVISAEDWNAIRSLLKDRLAEGSSRDDDYGGMSPDGDVIPMPTRDKGGAGGR